MKQIIYHCISMYPKTASSFTFYETIGREKKFRILLPEDYVASSKHYLVISSGHCPVGNMKQ